MTGDNLHNRQLAVDEAHLDAAIDAVAREMTEGEPSGALRARVLERIEQGRRHTSPAVPRWAWAGAAASVLVLAVATAIWVARPVTDPSDARATIAEQRAGGPASLPAGSAETPVQSAAASIQSPSAEGMPATAARGGRAVAGRGAQAARIEAAQDFNTVPALAEIEPMRFAEVEPAPLHITDVEIAPITEIPSLDVPSLDPDSRDIQIADPKKEK
jgi:hypothetical protein